MQTISSTLFASVLLFASVATTTQAQNANSAAALDVEITHATRGNINRWVTLPGNIHALQEATLYAKVPGYLKSINVDKGDSVRAGALLAEIEAPELIADLSRCRAEAVAAKAEYDRMQQAVQQAPDLIMPVELDRAKGKHEVAKANLERIETLLAFAKITAPFSGTITKRFVDLGAFIPSATSGSAAQNAAILTLMNFNVVRVQVAVPEAEAPLVSKGQPARFKIDELPGRNFEGKVTHLAYALDESSKTMLAEIEMPNPKLELRPGMYVSVQIGLERREGALLMPTAALVVEKTNAFVYIAASNVAKKTPIKIGFNDGSKVEIVEGVTENDAVILVGKRSLTNGQQLRVTEAK
jgi:RND family efflux transporter MFP subunit